MGDRFERYEDNVPGRWYVDKKCILCSSCAQTAPRFFKASLSGDHDHVFQQPASTEEEAECQEALDGCPVEAIGNDGLI